MSAFVMMGKYSSESLKNASSARTKNVVEIIEKLNGRVISMYALLGEYDIALVVDFDTVKLAMKCSIEITKLTGISITSYPAVTMEDFDKNILLEI